MSLTTAQLARLKIRPGSVEDMHGPGRNTCWKATALDGRPVFVKRLTGEPADADSRFHRAVSFERVAPRQQGSGLRHPRLLASHAPSRLLVYPFLTATSGSDLLSDHSFTEDLAHTAGRALARLHTIDHLAGTDVPTTPPLMPPLSFFEALPEDAFIAATGAELQAWKLLQRDTQVRAALHGLREQEEQTHRRPIHGDLRFDQLLLAGDTLYLTDWEEFRLGDPARDLGAFLGELVWTATTRIPRSSPSQGQLSDAPTEQDVTAAGARELRRLRPLAMGFFRGYYDGRAVMDDSHLAARVVGFAGWHLIDRVLSHSGSRPALAPTARAALGISRTLLSTPGPFIDVLGCGGPS
ncbi:class V lanthionine synthetase subunit LxmK [Streptomyces sp. NPDC059009]|uniref:class V lanthionine synthetase subunit LxmK n=1 Tax=Streptomyces sp. NPDC059009 TaxID=3346694 RepID=UPI003680E148